MVALGKVRVELKVVLGTIRLPIRQVLRLGRGATIPLDCGTEDLSELQVNGQLLARGRIRIEGESMSFDVAELAGGGR